MTGIHKRAPRGFTLVEILTVIVIISILAGLAIPAITGALNSARKAAIRTEVENLAQGIESYKLKYGDYPPDFSSWAVVQSHYRKIFPEIQLSELTLLYRMCDNVADNSSNQTTTSTTFVPSAMDRAEALIWALGGFSSDPQYPFTGSGGPLVLMPTVSASPSNATNPAVWQYNSARDNSLMDLELDDLTIKSPTSSAAISYANRVESTEDLINPSGTPPNFKDVFPTYRSEEDGSPYVYFDSRTYRLDVGGGSLNGYATQIDNQWDVARPVFNDRVNANLPVPGASGSTYGSRAAAMMAWEPMNPNTFQILSPGMDGRFGVLGDADAGAPTDADPVYWQYPTGKLLRALPSAENPQDMIVADVDRYGLDLLFAGTAMAREAFEKDNMANFTDSTFEDDLAQ